MRSIGGHVAPGYEAMVEAMERAVETGGEKGLGVAAYVRGEKVIDAWCGRANASQPWDSSTLAVLFSCAKGVSALCAHVLLDRGQLDPQAPVAGYWPEYGVNGKEGTLVRHILNHTAGVMTFPRYWEMTTPDGQWLAETATITERLAAAPPHWVPGTVAQYHALTFGWLVGELVQRIDGRSIGRFFAEEVAAPLGLQLWIGLPPAEVHRVATPIPPRFEPDPSRRWPDVDTIRRCSRALREGDLSSLETVLYGSLFLPVEQGDAPLDVGLHVARALSNPAVWEAEVPAANAIGNAGSLARMYAPLASDGSIDGTRLVSPGSIASVVTHQPLDSGGATGFGLGYVLEPPEVRGCGPSERAFGHSGAGGSLGFADPEHQVSFGLVKNQMHNDPATAQELVSALYSCL